MYAFSLKLAQRTACPGANLDQADLERIDGVVRRYGDALNERVRVVSAMRSAAVTLNETAYREAELQLQAVHNEMRTCSLELAAIPGTHTLSS